MPILVLWLREVQQKDAADWFQEYWTSRRGRWTSGHAGHANVRTNSSLEGFIGECKNNWLGAGYRNCSQNPTEFIGSITEDVKQKSLEHHNMQMSSVFGIASFQKFSVVTVTPDVVTELKNLHQNCLWLAHHFFGQKRISRLHEGFVFCR